MENPLFWLYAADIPTGFICPVCMEDTGEPSDPINLCARHRRQLEDSKK